MSEPVDKSKLSKGQLKKLKQKQKAAEAGNPDDDALLDSLVADTAPKQEETKKEEAKDTPAASTESGANTEGLSKG